MDAINTAVQWFGKLSSLGWSPNTWLGIGISVFFVVVLVLEARRIQWVSNRKPKQKKTPGGAIVSVVSPQEVALKRTSSWLLQVLAFNQKNIYTAVQGRIALWRFYGINTLEPYFEFAVELINTSIFTLHFLGVSGFIKIDGNKCQLPPKASERWSIIQGEKFTGIIEQPVAPDMQKRIKEANIKKEQMTFELGNLELNMETTTEGFKDLKPRITLGSPEIVPEPM